MWTDYFKIIKVLPGRIVTPRFGTVDFSDPNLSLEKVKALYEDKLPYLELTPQGKETLYPDPPPEKLEVHEPGVIPVVKSPRKLKK